MLLPDFTAEHLKQLPLRAIVAFAARCARRVEDLAQLPDGNPEREKRRNAVEAALRMAEQFAAGSVAPPEDSVVAAVDAIRTESGGSVSSRNAAAAAAEAAHAALAAWHVIHNREREKAESQGTKTAEARKLLSAIEHSTADLAELTALDAFTAAEVAYGSVGYNNEGFVATVLNDYDKLRHLPARLLPGARKPDRPVAGRPTRPFVNSRIPRPAPFRLQGVDSVAIHPLAGQPAPLDMLIDVSALENAYYQWRPDPGNPRQGVAFGTSGHRGSSFDKSFNEAHILAITQAICEYRARWEITGPLFLGKDTHALSAPAQRTALEVLAAHGVEVMMQRDDGVTPTPVISHAILTHNRARRASRADGIVVTPSHNPPADGGFKYDPPHGGPAETGVTSWIQDRANALLRAGEGEVRRIPFEKAIRARTTHQVDFVAPYVEDLSNAIDMDAIRSAGLKLGVDPLGGAAAHYWQPIADRYGLDITVTNPAVDPTFRFMTLDHDGQIRMDCSSPYAMAGLVKLKDRFDVAFGNDPDSDRHGIVTRSSGLMNPNHFLAVAIRYLLTRRPGWPTHAAVGKTVVSSGIIDRVVEGLGRKLVEVPVGFKWFVAGLFNGFLGFAGEESAGASFLRRDGTVWTTDKDGPLLDLLAAEITAKTGKDPGEHYGALTAEYGTPLYTRIDALATPAQKALLQKLSPESVQATELAGEPITAKLTRTTGIDEPIGGLKVTAASGWFAARPSGTEDVYKIYAESFKDQGHLDSIVEEAQRIVAAAIS